MNDLAYARLICAIRLPSSRDCLFPHANYYGSNHITKHITLFIHPYRNHSKNIIYVFLNVVMNIQNNMECLYIGNLIAHITIGVYKRR